MTTRQRVLELLERNRNHSLSGEEIAGMLQVSRTAVWKAVNELKKAGYEVEAVTNRGYRLAPRTDILSVEGMGPFLKSDFDLGRIHLFQEVESTNHTASRMLLDGAPEGTVVLADSQKAGKGRRGRSFYSPPGRGIYLSMILPANIIPDSSPSLITTAASVAVYRAIRQVTGLEVWIKWVNDLYHEGKKVCGILTEAVTDFESGLAETAILGVGINFSTLPEEFPPEVRETAGSLCPGNPDCMPRNRLAGALITELSGLGSMIARRSFLEEYRARCMVLGRRVSVLNPGGAYSALAEDIDGEGRLLIRMDNGEAAALSGGEISIREDC